MLITLRDERVKDHLYPNVFRTQLFHNKTANLLVRLFFLVLRLPSMCSWRSPRKKYLIPCSFTKGWAAHKKDSNKPALFQIPRKQNKVSRQLIYN